MMNKNIIYYLILLFIPITKASSQSLKNDRPNIVYILADDLGYGDIGPYGQKKIETPNLDALAEEGMLFTQHYAQPVCAPSRFSLMTGQNSGHAYIRGNDEWAERGDVWNFKEMEANPSLEGQRPIPDSILTLAEILQKNGYKTGLIGKWGLGGPLTTGVPNNQGFDYFYGYLCQRQDHNYFSGHLWENENRVPLNNVATDPAIEFPDSLDKLDPKNYLGYSQEDYSPTFIFQAVLRFLDSCSHSDTPFFLYYPSPLPHTSLQAPKELVDYYHKKFGDEDPYLGGSYLPVRYPHATRAAMITLLDQNVGKIIDKLKAMGAYENTIIVFTGDNGATYEGGSDPEWFNAGGPFKSSFGWGKGSVHEGGIREPFIISWPKIVPKNSKSDLISGNWDFLPTICEILNITPPSDIQGVSYLPTLKGDHENQKIHPYLYWEFPGYGGMQAVRMGKWKAIITDIVEKGNAEIQLFDLNKDIQELNDVSKSNPEIIKEIKDIMKEEHTFPQVKSFRMKALDGVDGIGRIQIFK